MARFLPDGTRDASFGAQGLVIGIDGDHGLGEGLCVMPDGRIVVVGRLGSDMAVVRYLP